MPANDVAPSTSDAATDCATVPSMVTTPRIDPHRMGAWRAFLTAHARVVERLAAELEEQEGLPLAWYDVLVHLHEADDHRLRMQELAARVLLSKSGLTRLVDRMEAAGLVERIPCPDDRRGTFAALTAAGVERLRETAPTHVEGVRRHFTDLVRDDEAELLREVLERVAEAER
jgi:DNA-binding MarR family transcriptional regulator